MIYLTSDFYFELILSKDEVGDFEVWLMGHNRTFANNKQMLVTKMFGIRFKLLASEYIFRHSILHIGKKSKKTTIPFSEQEFRNVNETIKKINNKIQELIPKEFDSKKKRLFDLIYKSKGDISVQELAEKSY